MTDKKQPSDSTRWPAEWESHAGTWLAWPHNQETWPRNLLASQREYAAFVRAIAEVETVWLVIPSAQIDHAKSLIDYAHNIEMVAFETNDAWIRDYGPTFVDSAGDLTVVDWTYNAWGGKYPPFDHDAQFAQVVAERLKAPSHKVGFTIEGGALEGNGAGVVMTTQSCLLNDNRNGKSAQSAIEDVLQVQLGAEEVWWLSGGEIAGDDTDSHIDQIARFVSPNTIVVATETDRSDINYTTLTTAKKELEQINANRNQKYTIVDLPLPDKVELEGVRLPASYANFYFANGITIVPQFGDSNDPNDARAIEILKEHISGDIIGLSSQNLVVGLGSFHCLSQQQPLCRTAKGFKSS